MRSQHHNKRAAFIRLVESREFKAWHRAEVARRLGKEAQIGEAVDAAMHPRNLRVDVMTADGWRAELAAAGKK